VGPRAGLDIEDIGKILCLCWGLNLDLAVVQFVVRTMLTLTELPWLPLCNIARQFSYVNAVGVSY
jgi:hypothetical protein